MLASLWDNFIEGFNLFRIETIILLIIYLYPEQWRDYTKVIWLTAGVLTKIHLIPDTVSNRSQEGIQK